MKNVKHTGRKLGTTFSVAAGMLCLAGSAHAARVRHCDYTFSAVVETFDIFSNVVRQKAVVLSGETAGRHGGVQANTARERARKRINSCVGSWNDLDDNLSSSELNECTNDNISNIPGFDVETDGSSLRGTIAELFPDLCSSLQCSEEVLVRVSDASLHVSGGNRCSSSTNFELEEMLVGELCQGL